MGINIAGLSGMDVLPITQQTVEALEETQSIDSQPAAWPPPPFFFILHRTSESSESHTHTHRGARNDMLHQTTHTMN